MYLSQPLCATSSLCTVVAISARTTVSGLVADSVIRILASVCARRGTVIAISARTTIGGIVADSVIRILASVCARRGTRRVVTIRWRHAIAIRVANCVGRAPEVLAVYRVASTDRTASARLAFDQITRASRR